MSGVGRERLEGYLREQRNVEPQLAFLDPLRLRAHLADRTVEPLEHRSGDVLVVGRQAGRAQHSGHPAEGHRLVLRGEGVDRRRDHG